MKKAQEFYAMAKGREAELHDLALDFYQKYIEYFEEEAKEGSFYGMIYGNDIPEELRDVFDELVIPLFENEGFTATEKESYPFLGEWSIDWKISWEKAYE